MKKTLISILISSSICAAAVAAPADRTPISVKQPDGKTLTVILNGDEHSHYFTTIDGLPVKRDEAGCFRYITAYDGLSEVLSDVQASDPQQRGSHESALVSELQYDNLIAQTQERQRVMRVKKLAANSLKKKSSAFPNTGEVRGLVILVEFNDRKFIDGNDRDAFDRMLNEENYQGDSYGSAYDYFTAQSHGQFQPHFDVYGPVELSNDYSFYGRNDWVGDDINAHIMISESCELLDDEIDFSNYDYDNDGTVDLVFVLYAGYGENSGADSNTIWPHASDLIYYFDSPIIKDGKQLGPYACSCELRGNENSSTVSTAGIGVFCHEFSHCLGLMDMYDTNGSTGGEGRGYGSFSVMDMGCYNNSGYTPCSYTAYERMVIGWLTPTVLGDEYYENLTLADINQENEAYAIYNPNNENEFFILENRQQTGWDNALPAKGMMISHIDYREEDWEMNVVNSYYEDEGAYLVPANNNYSSLTEGSKLYPNTSNNSFTNQSTPAAQFKDGTYTDRPITNIRDANGTIYFTYNELSLSKPVALPATEITDDAFTANWEYVKNAESYTLTVTDLGVNPHPGALIYEDFSKFTSGSEDSPTSSDVSARLDEFMTDEGWRGSKVYQAGGKCKLGTTTAIGYLVSPEIFMPTHFTISVDAKDYVTASGNADKATLYIGVGRKTETGEGGEWIAYKEFPLTQSTETYTLTCDLGGENLCFEIGTLSKRAIIDNVAAESSQAKAPAAETSRVYTDIRDNYYRVTGLDKSHNYSYTVKAIAGDMESEESDAIKVNMSLSIDDYAADTDRAVISVSGTQLTITTDAKCQVRIFTTDGLCIADRTVDHQLTMTLNKGIYIITINGKSQKVMI